MHQSNQTIQIDISLVENKIQSKQMPRSNVQIFPIFADMIDTKLQFCGQNFWNSIFFLWGLKSIYDLKQILMSRVCQSNTYKNLRYENRLHSKFMKEYTIIFTTLPMKREIGFLNFSRYLFSVHRYII